MSAVDTTTTPALRMAYASLRALRTVDEEGWGYYIAGEPPDGRHTVQLPNDTYRTLLRGEPYWWALGMADGHGHGDQVAALLTEPMPELVPTAVAAGMIPATDRWGTLQRGKMTRDGIVYNINTGRLFAVYGSRRQRYLLLPQIAAETAARELEAATRQNQGPPQNAVQAAAKVDLGPLRRRATQTQLAWTKARALLPPAVRPGDLADAIVTRPSPTPLPVPTGQGDRRLRALQLGEAAGWFKYLAPHLGGYLVDVDLYPRLLPPEGVLPWVLGMGDRHGRGSSVAYREMLG